MSDFAPRRSSIQAVERFARTASEPLPSPPERTPVSDTTEHVHKCIDPDVGGFHCGYRGWCLCDCGATLRNGSEEWDDARNTFSELPSGTLDTRLSEESRKLISRYRDTVFAVGHGDDVDTGAVAVCTTARRALESHILNLESRISELQQDSRRLEEIRRVFGTASGLMHIYVDGEWKLVASPHAVLEILITRVDSGLPL